MKNKKRFLLILTDLNMGGITTSAENLCDLLCSHGDSVDVLVMSDTNETEKMRFNSNINFKSLFGIAKLWNLSAEYIKKENNLFKKALLYLLGGIKKFANKKSLWIKLLFNNKIYFSGYDVVIAYRQCSPCYYFALNCVKADKKIAFVHGDLNFMGDISTWQRYMYEFDAVAYVSNAVKNGFIERYGDLQKNAVTVYNTFNVERILSKSKQVSICDFDKSIFNIVTVSRVEKMKGIGRILELCSNLKKKYGNIFHWYVIGDGKDLEVYKSKNSANATEDVLTFLGQKANPYPYFGQADISVLPTFTEAFPMTVGESLILGVPIVSTRYAAVEEIIVDGENGLIAEQNIDSIFEKICCLIDNSEFYNKIKNNCIAFNYDNERSYIQLMEAINQ